MVGAPGVRVRGAAPASRGWPGAAGRAVTVFRFGVRVAAPAEDPAPAREALVAPLVLGVVADAVVEGSVAGGPAGRRGLVYFDRDAATLPAAVVTALEDLENSGLECLAAVPDDDLVTLDLLAPRTGGGPGGRRLGSVPAVECGGRLVFRWSDVVARLEEGPENGRPAGRSEAPALRAVNLALRLRGLIRGDPALVAAVRALLGA